MKFAFIAAAAILGTSSPALAQTNLITNGNFESFTTAPNMWRSFEFGASYLNGANQVTGWTSASTTAYNVLFHSATAGTNSAKTRWGGNYEWLWAYTANPVTGEHFVALDGDSTVRGPLTQMVNGLVVGQSYTLTFDWGAGQFGSRDGATTEQLQVGFGDSVFKTEILSNPDHGFQPFRSVTTNFTATNTSQLLSFLSIGTPNGLPPVALLDNVRMTAAATAAVPEPATWLMMILGFGGVAGSLRRRSRVSRIRYA